MHMRIHLAAGLLLATPVLHAYQIVEGRYRVETAPGVFEDQLVVRCDDGRTLTLPWETRLAEACGEGLMGERVGKGAKAPVATPALEPSAPLAEALAVPAEPAIAGNPATLFDEGAQREVMLAQIRAQFGDVPERFIEFKPGPDGLSMRLLPPLNEIVKKYEACRRAREPGSQCAATRDQALAKLGETPAPAAAAPSAPTSTSGTSRTKPGNNGIGAKASAKPDGAVPAAEAAAAPDTRAPKANAGGDTTTAERAAASPQPDAVAPGARSAALAPMERSAMEQKIAEDHALCMRLKPRFECEQARARALGALDRPKPAKPARPAKQAKAAPGQVAAAPAQ